MNKAFVKESEDPGDRCPGCGAIGTSVYQTTIRTHVPDEEAERLADPAFFCPYPTCDIVYFDEFQQSIPVSSLNTTLYPKHPEAPICPCFGFTCDEIDADISEGVATRTRAHLERAKSAEADCATKTADGRSCVAAVQRYFMQARNPDNS